MNAAIACHPVRRPAVVGGMRKRLPWTLALLLGAAAPAASGAGTRLVVQSSPLAGFQFYDARESWDEMKVGDALELVREPDNAHDPDAVRVLWRGRMLGYVPKRENAHVARQLDRGVALQAKIVTLQAHPNPRNRLAFEVYVGL